MRGRRERSGSLFSYVSIEERIPASHPPRWIRKLADQAFDRLNPTFCELYAAGARGGANAVSRARNPAIGRGARGGGGGVGLFSPLQRIPIGGDLAPAIGGLQLSQPDSGQGLGIHPQGLIAHGEHLTNRCQGWTDDMVRQRGWAPEVA